jgi:hypothetical protein
MAPAEQRNVAGYVTLLPTRFLKEAKKNPADTQEYGPFPPLNRAKNYCNDSEQNSDHWYE